MFKRIVIPFLFCQSYFAQQKIHIQKQDNRFLFYQIATHNDTITVNKNDLFFMKLPDSLRKHLIIFTENAQLKKVYSDSLIYQIQYINGMKYSHQNSDTAFVTLLEGICKPSKQITFSIYNSVKRKEVFRNMFWVK